MRNWYLRGFLPLILLVLLGSVKVSAGTFLGCAEWCASRYLPKSGSASRDQMLRYDNCVVQTQREGRCGSGSTNRGSGGGTSRPSQTQRPAESRQQQEPPGSSQTNPCGNRCPVNQCLDVNGNGGYVCQSEIQQRGPDCSAQYSELVQRCSEAVEETAHTCDEKNDSGMGGVANMASQLSLMFGQQTASSIQAACSRMAGLSAAANAAVAAYRLNCSSSISSCRSACSELVDYVTNNPTCTVQGFSGAAGDNSMIIESARSQAERCDRFENKVQEANQAIANYAGTMQNASQCADQTSGDTTVPEICKANPNLPGCSSAGPVDCTKPEMATNKVCICSKNPTDPVCRSEKGMNGTTYSSINSAARLNSVGGDGPGGDLPGLPSISPGKPGPGGAGEAVEGRQGAGAGLALSGGGAGGGASGSGSGQAESDSLDPDVNAGFYGGGGGGAYGGGAMGSAGGSAGKAGAVGADGKAGGPDLRQFLPGGKFDPKARGVAGVSGPDGITGPHSNIWKKIQNRYQVLSPTLMP